MAVPADECLFCRIAKRELSSKMVFEDNKIMAFEDTNPQAPIHIIVIPKYHISKLSDAKAQDRRLLGDLILRTKDIAREKSIEESGYRIVINSNRAAGQTIFHLHLHLLGGRAMGWPPG